MTNSITTAQQNARAGAELGDLRRNAAQAAAEGELARGERLSYEAQVRIRAIELFVAGYTNEARALVARELGR